LRQVQLIQQSVKRESLRNELRYQARKLNFELANWRSILRRTRACHIVDWVAAAHTAARGRGSFAQWWQMMHVLLIVLTHFAYSPANAGSGATSSERHMSAFSPRAART
jgi:hypothetical protein